MSSDITLFSVKRRHSAGFLAELYMAFFFGYCATARAGRYLILPATAILSGNLFVFLLGERRSTSYHILTPSEGKRQY